MVRDGSKNYYSESESRGGGASVQEVESQASEEQGGDVQGEAEDLVGEINKALKNITAVKNKRIAKLKQVSGKLEDKKK